MTISYARCGVGGRGVGYPVGVLIALSLLAQDGRAQVPTAGYRTIAGGFTEVTAVRELPGRVIVLDAREQQLMVIDTKSGARRLIGRAGAGPSEYRRATTLLRGPGDTTYVTDAGNGRLLVLDGRAEIVGVISQWAEGKLTIGLSAGADRQGYVYGLMPRATGGDPAAPPDSLHLVRVSVASGAASILAVLAAPPTRITVRRNGDQVQGVDIVRPPFGVGDQFQVAADGRVAIARRDPYRLDVLSPAGKLARGPEIREPPVSVGAAERAAYLETLAPAARTRAEALDWPPTLPPFPTRAVHALDDGTTWVRRSGRANDPRTAYDVFDRSGRRTRTVMLEGNRHLVSITPAGMWLARRDDDGLQQLEFSASERDGR